MSIYDAVKYVQPGQTIVVMEGTYYLGRQLRLREVLMVQQISLFRW